MIYAAAPDGQRVAAHPDLRHAGVLCPSCRGAVVAHCGPLVSWHWAHRSSDCDPWSEPESPWHRTWKKAAETDRRAHVEVTRTVGDETHRADIVLPGGLIIELQHGYLSADDIAARETFWGPRLVWLYDAEQFIDRIHWGARGGFWWKNGAQSMATHKSEVWWHIGNELLLVDLHVVTINRRTIDSDTGEIDNETSRRVLGRVRRREQIDTKYPSFWELAITHGAGA